MGWPVISAQEALARLQNGARALDVRSPKEFLKGAIPGFANVPILNDDHRHLVGLAFKQHGQEAAVKLGHELVAPLRADLIRMFINVLAPAGPEERLLICWRGGLRSLTASEWLTAEGIMGCRVEGGYKALRNELLRVLQDPPPLILLSGMTGVGKSELLGELTHLYVADIEACANHRGSAFGGHLNSPQPSQQSFENRLALQLSDQGAAYLLEDESLMIGMCAIPEPLRERMNNAPVVILEDTMENRVRRVFAEYVADPGVRLGREAVCKALLGSLERIGRRLGGVKLRELQEAISAAFRQPTDELRFHSPWIETLLREYYDPRYVYSAEQHGREILCRGNARQLKSELEHRLARRRT